MFEILCLCLLLLSFVFILSLIQKLNESIDISFSNIAVNNAIDSIDTNFNDAIDEISSNMGMIISDLYKI
jgi:hypothetical protein